MVRIHLGSGFSSEFVVYEHSMPCIFPIIGGSCHKYNCCRDKHNFVATKVLSQQAYFCLDKRRVCLDKIRFVTTNVFSRQAYFCRVKIRVFFCRNKTFVATNISGDKGFVATSIRLSRQKTCFSSTNMCLSRQKYACRDKIMFVVILVAAPANDAFRAIINEESQ